MIVLTVGECTVQWRKRVFMGFSLDCCPVAQPQIYVNFWLRFIIITTIIIIIATNPKRNANFQLHFIIITVISEDPK